MTEKSYLLKVGAMLRNGTYRIDKALASGGFGNTYKVTNVNFGETYAMKEFFIRGVNERDSDTLAISVSNGENTAQFGAMKEKFRKEAVRLRKLDSPHIVKVYDLFEENGTAYYVMDYIDGESLSSLLKRGNEPLPESQVRDYFTQILDALDTIHKANIWHLDLKPGNIMVDRSGNVKLIDFGASKQYHDSDGHSLSTSTGLCYTPGYAPLEQTNQDYRLFGPWTDFYALGATLFNLLTNRIPPSPAAILSENDALALPREISQDTRQLILWLMQPSRQNRPQSVEEIRHWPDRKNYPREETHFASSSGSTPGEDDDETLYDRHAKNQADNKQREHYNAKNSETDEAETERKRKYRRYNMIALSVFLGVIAIFTIVLVSKPFGNAQKAEATDLDSVVDTTAAFTDSIKVDGIYQWCTYKGERDNEGRPDGQGEAFFEDGARYKGPFKAGMAHGKGFYYQSDGTKISLESENGIRINFEVINGK